MDKRKQDNLKTMEQTTTTTTTTKTTTTTTTTMTAKTATRGNSNSNNNNGNHSISDTALTIRISHEKGLFTTEFAYKIAVKQE